MSISAIGSSPSPASSAGQKPQEAEELTTITMKCKKKHTHDQSCPHTVSTRPAPGFGEKGHMIDKKV